MADEARRGHYERPAAAQVLAFAGLGVGLAAVAGAEPRDAAAVRWSVASVIAVTVLGALVAGRGRQRRRSRPWLAASRARVRGWRRQPLAVVGAAVWCGLVAAFGVADGASFAARRVAMPTLSRAIGELTAAGPGRALVAIAWVAWGGWAALGWRFVRR